MLLKNIAFFDNILPCWFKMDFYNHTKYFLATVCSSMNLPDKNVLKA